jgi:hypothetical protein
MYVAIPDDVIEEYLDNFIEQCGLGFLQRHGHDLTRPKKKQKMVKYDRQRTADCVSSNWMNPCPRFDDKQFERTFRIKRSMVDDLISKLQIHVTFWLQTRDACGKISICPRVKFLAAMKLAFIGVSFSAFKDYFQIGETTVFLCLS